ncbi:hypothetical protein B0T20DRAFT_409619 [Sordaria brevicollis]|uniref:Uncharacterized protein n=1 Tax=Sordaria brevicollis TaxID=83679 RepID=A0AAE0UCP0_SORBR|nr:hypothetical protein B0T20DRAFT_409619 [Sordaria brevicollis]
MTLQTRTQPKRCGNSERPSTVIVFNNVEPRQIQTYLRCCDISLLPRLFTSIVDIVHLPSTFHPHCFPAAPRHPVFYVPVSHYPPPNNLPLYITYKYTITASNPYCTLHILRYLYSLQLGIASWSCIIDSIFSLSSSSVRMPPRTAPQISHTTTILLFLVLLVAFFPGSFHYLWTLPFKLLALPFTLLSSLITSSSGATTSSPIESQLPYCQQPQQATMSWSQKTFSLPAQSRGAYLITDIVLNEVPEIKQYKVGLLNLFIQHTSCALSLNENWDPDVRLDMSDTLDRIVPEATDKNPDLYRHSDEGPDDFPAHVKSSLIGTSVTIPIKNGKLATGTWQGIWYLEFRAHKHRRNIVATIQGEKEK